MKVWPMIQYYAFSQNNTRVTTKATFLCNNANYQANAKNTLVDWLISLFLRVDYHDLHSPLELRCRREREKERESKRERERERE